MSRVAGRDCGVYSSRMMISLRHFARSRCLRVMGVLAWLMLASTSVMAAPMNMATHHESATRLMAAAGSGHCPPAESAAHSVPAHQASPGCGGGLASTDCHCATMCASVTPVTLTQMTSVPLSPAYDRSLRIIAPEPNTAPPLRPPSV
jgi:hypothetical protein